MNKSPRWVRAITWIEMWCVVPSGPYKGQRVLLSQQQRSVIHDVLELGHAPPADDRPLCAYLALISLCGPEALRDTLTPPLPTDIFTVWEATSGQMRDVLVRRGDKILCPELGTAYAAA